MKGIGQVRGYITNETGAPAVGFYGARPDRADSVEGPLHYGGYTPQLQTYPMAALARKEKRWKPAKRGKTPVDPIAKSKL